MASDELTTVEGTEFWMVQTEPLDGQQTTLFWGLQVSSDPILVSIEGIRKREKGVEKRKRRTVVLD